MTPHFAGHFDSATSSCRLKIEQTALQKETDARSLKRLEEIKGEVAALQSEMDALTERWRVEKAR